MMSLPVNEFSMTKSAWAGRDQLGVGSAWGRRAFAPASFGVVLCGLLALAMPIQAKDKPVADGGPKNAVVLIIRHGEKPATGSSLSPAGKQRAKAYVKYFEDFSVNSKPLRLDYLIAAADSKESRRPRLTLEPLSKALDMRIDDRFPDTQGEKLANTMCQKPQGKQFLICWHHTEIPDLLRALGADPGALLPDGKWPDNVFGWVIQLRYGMSGKLLEAKCISENLMPDDAAK
jgi:hypothetical protein